jgi:hypothetical protein
MGGVREGGVLRPAAAAAAGPLSTSNGTEAWSWFSWPSPWTDGPDQLHTRQ